jgi:threonine/homoserine/homoserine lactone efflux protein
MLTVGSVAAIVESAGFVTTCIVLSAIVMGIVSSMAPLGPVTVLTIRQALGGDPSGALKVGFGRAPVESFYCGLATFGIVALLEQVPGARLTIEVIGTVVFLAVGIWLVVQQPKQPNPPNPGQDPRGSQWGYWAGFIISILNPTLILSWSAIVAIGLTITEIEPTLLQKILFPISLGVGIVLGCLMLVGLLKRYGMQLEQRFVRAVIRSMGVVFVLLSVWNGLTLVGLV